MATFKAEVFSVQFIIHYCPVKNERIAYSYLWGTERNVY